MGGILDTPDFRLTECPAVCLTIVELRAIVPQRHFDVGLYGFTS